MVCDRAGQGRAGMRREGAIMPSRLQRAVHDPTCPLPCVAWAGALAAGLGAWWAGVPGCLSIKR